MIKFFYGEEEYLIELEIKKLSNEFGNFTTFDSFDDLEDILLELSTVGMFSLEKNVVIKNHKMFTNKETANTFLNSINLKANNLNLIFVNSLKNDKSNPLIKFLLSNFESREFGAISQKEVPETIKNIVQKNGGKISNGASIKLAGKLPLNLRVIVNEINKLLLESLEITEEMVQISIGEYFNDDAFALVNSIVENDISGLMFSYKNKINLGEKPTLIISQISSILSTALLTSSLKRQGLSSRDISDLKKIHIFRVEKSLQLANRTGQEKLEFLIKSLSDVDKEIKLGIKDEYVAIEKYLLDLIK